VSRTRLLAAPLTVLLAVGLAACGGGTPSAESPTPTATRTTATPTPTPTPTVEALSAENVLTRMAAAQAGITSYDLAMSVTGTTSMEMTGSADLAAGKRNASVVMSDPEMGGIEMRFVDGLMYLNLGELTGGLFLQLDPNDTSNELSTAFAGFDDMLVKSGFEGTEQAVVSVTAVGAPETLDGVEVQAYEVVLDTTKFTPEATSELLEEGMAALPPTVTYTYWIDGDDVPRKTVYEINGAVTTLTISKLGAGTPVTAPAADQVTTDLPF